MNNCLADLSRLLPAAYMKKGRGRIEKTEIIEMTIRHMKHLQIHACKDIGTLLNQFPVFIVIYIDFTELYNNSLYHSRAGNAIKSTERVWYRLKKINRYQ